MSDMLRITGMVSGMDTDATVKKLIQGEQLKVDKAKQEKQYLEWQREDYREVANLIRGFQDEFFDVLKPESNIRSTKMFGIFSSTATISGTATSAVTIKTSSKSMKGIFTIDSVARLATRDKYQSGSEVLGNITTGNLGTISDINDKVEANNKLSFTFDGVTKVIELDKTDYADRAALASDLSTKLQEAFSNVDIKAEVSGNTLEFKIYKNGTSTEEPGHVLTINGDNSDLLTKLSLKSGQSNSVNTNKSLEDVFGKTADSTMTINGVEFKFSKETSVADMMSQINTSAAGVTMSYDSFTDKFTLESTKYGSDSTISITDTSNLLQDMKLQGASSTHTSPVNAEFVVNGVATTRSSNTFTFNGTNVTLNEIPTGPVKIDVKSDTTSTKEKIMKFIDSYNTMISKINDMKSTRKNRDYKPLTDAQKKELSDDDKKAWEKEARKGTLHGDRRLDNILTSLRSAMYEKIDGLSINMYDLGITTTKNYKDRGKLVVDEKKLDKALEERPNEVIELFTKQSSTAYTSYKDRATRNSENGIGYRLYDIIQDSIRLTRDDDGNKGYLIDKAGLSTGTDTTSDFAEKIKDMDKTIEVLLKRLASQEKKYYQQFAAMEKAMSSLSSQSAFLKSQFGGK